MKTTEAKTERITARITPQQKRLLKQAANIRGRSLTDFLVDSAQREAEQAIQNGLVIQFSLEQQQQFIEALLHPPEPNTALKKAAQHYQDTPLISQ